jgi:integrase
LDTQISTELEDPLQTFLYALRAPETKRKYPQRLKFFFDSIFPDLDINSQAIEFIKKAKGNDQFVYSSFINFIVSQNKRVDKKDITPGTVRNYYKAAKLFCEMNDIVVNWKKIAKGLLREKQYGDDRAPTLDEISQLMKYPDRRIKPIILVMASSGIRGGAWDYLKWKHIIPIKKDGQIIAAKILVYCGEPDEYYSFITPEAYFALKEWMDFRRSYGEEITGESTLMRDMWQTTTKNEERSIQRRGTVGVVAYPKSLKYGGIKSLMERAIRSQGIEKIRKKGTNYNTRREWKILHGFRKFFNSVLVNANVNHIKKEKMMGHDTRLENNYFKPNGEDLLSEYLKVVDLLTMNEEFRLRKKIEKLEIEKSRMDIMSSQIAEIQRAMKSKKKIS